MVGTTNTYKDVYTNAFNIYEIKEEDDNVVIDNPGVIDWKEHEDYGSLSNSDKSEVMDFYKKRIDDNALTEKEFLEICNKITDLAHDGDGIVTFDQMDRRDGNQNDSILFDDADNFMDVFQNDQRYKALTEAGKKDFEDRLSTFYTFDQTNNNMSKSAYDDIISSINPYLESQGMNNSYGELVRAWKNNDYKYDELHIKGLFDALDVTGGGKTNNLIDADNLKKLLENVEGMSFDGKTMADYFVITTKDNINYDDFKKIMEKIITEKDNPSKQGDSKNLAEVTADSIFDQADKNDNNKIEDYAVAINAFKKRHGWDNLTDNEQKDIETRAETAVKNGGGMDLDEFKSLWNAITEYAKEDGSQVEDKTSDSTETGKTQPQEEEENETTEGNETTKIEEEEDKETTPKDFSEEWERFLGDKSITELSNAEINALFEALPSSGNANRKYVSADALATKLGLKASDLENLANITIKRDINQSEFLEIIRAYKKNQPNDDSDTKKGSTQIDYNSGYRSYEEMKDMLKVADNKTIETSDKELIDVFNDDFRYKVLDEADQKDINEEIQRLNVDKKFNKADYTELDNFVDDLILENDKAGDLAEMIDNYNNPK